jgi:hypothetical protein
VSVTVGPGVSVTAGPGVSVTAGPGVSVTAGPGVSVTAGFGDCEDGGLAGADIDREMLPDEPIAFPVAPVPVSLLAGDGCPAVLAHAEVAATIASIVAAVAVFLWVRMEIYLPGVNSSRMAGVS